MSTLLDEIITTDVPEEEKKEEPKPEPKPEPIEEPKPKPEKPKQLPIIVSEPRPKFVPQVVKPRVKRSSALVVIILIFIIMMLIGGMILLINYIMNRPPINTMAPVIYSTQMTGGEKIKGFTEERTKRKKTQSKGQARSKGHPCK